MEIYYFSDRELQKWTLHVWYDAFPVVWDSGSFNHFPPTPPYVAFEGMVQDGASCFRKKEENRKKWNKGLIVKLWHLRPCVLWGDHRALRRAVSGVSHACSRSNLDSQRPPNEILRSTDLHFKEMMLNLQPEACLHPDHPRCSAPRVNIVHQFNDHPGQFHCSVSFVFSGLICWRQTFKINQIL